MVEVAKKHGVCEATVYAWGKRIGIMDVPDTKRLKSLEAQNNRLKKLFASETSRSR
jgi:putative transposase